MPILTALAVRTLPEPPELLGFDGLDEVSAYNLEADESELT